MIERINRGCYHWLEDYSTSEVVIVNRLFCDAVLCMLISYNKILVELSTFFTYNPERQERINKNVTTTSTFGYLMQCASSIMITGVERGDFVPVLPVKDIMAFIIASFDGIIRDVTLSKCYAGNSSGVAFHEKNLIHCLYISTMSLLRKNQNER